MRLHTVQDDKDFLCTPAREASTDAGFARFKPIFDEMEKVMVEKNGIGIAAQQVGLDERLCIVAVVKGSTHRMINPVIKHATYAKVRGLEGCLSCPGEQYQVLRSTHVTVEYLTEQGTTKTFRADGLTARCIQHELDHLDGVLIRDRAVNPGNTDLFKPKKEKQ